jgi:predicted nucleic acid-binding protein
MGAVYATQKCCAHRRPFRFGPDIAATSLQHDVTVVARNTDDLERCGRNCVNPWTET